MPKDTSGHKTMPIGMREVHVWTTVPESIQTPDLLRHYDAMMSPEEHRRQQRFRYQKHRHQYRVTRALVRTALSRYTAVSPERWVFVQTEFGRPEPAPGQCELPLRFNLSHTDGLVACAVALERDIGIDVESLDRSAATDAVAERHFSASEAQALKALPEARRAERFFHYWTLKEAYIKARGMGISLGLERFSLHLGGSGPVRISFAPELDDDPADWQFELFRPTSRHVLAVAVRRGTGSGLAIQVRETVPLVI